MSPWGNGNGGNPFYFSALYLLFRGGAQYPSTQSTPKLAPFPVSLIAFERLALNLEEVWDDGLAATSKMVLCQRQPCSFGDNFFTQRLSREFRQGNRATTRKGFQGCASY